VDKKRFHLGIFTSVRLKSCPKVRAFEANLADAKTFSGHPISFSPTQSAYHSTQEASASTFHIRFHDLANRLRLAD